MKISISFRTLTPTYGRDYKNKKDVSTDFLNSKDFILQPEGQYCSILDFTPGTIVILRYNSLKSTTTQKVP